MFFAPTKSLCSRSSTGGVPTSNSSSGVQPSLSPSQRPISSKSGTGTFEINPGVGGERQIELAEEEGTSSSGGGGSHRWIKVLKERKKEKERKREKSREDAASGNGSGTGITVQTVSVIEERVVATGTPGEEEENVRENEMVIERGKKVSRII